MPSDINQTETDKYYYDLTSMSNLKKQTKKKNHELMDRVEWWLPEMEAGRNG